MKKISIIALCILAPALAGAADGVKAYAKHCLRCHGATGAGDGPSAKAFNPKPTDFTDAKYQAKVTDAQLFDATKLGAKATTVKVSKKMPAYAQKMTDAEITAVVKVMRDFGAAKK